MKKLKLQLVTLFYALSLLTSLTARECYPENVSQEQVQEKIARKAARAQLEYEAYEANLENSSGVSSKAKKILKDSTFSAAVNYETTNQKAWHFATGVSPRGDHVYLEDGSGWNVRSSDAYKTLDWYGSDVIALTLTPWFAYYDFALVNGRTGAKVYVEMNEIPNNANAYTLWITNIDLQAGRVTLCDDSVWEVASYDTGILWKWEIAQKVIIGVNNRGFFSRKYNFLLNQDAPSYVLADCLYGKSY